MEFIMVALESKVLAWFQRRLIRIFAHIKASELNMGKDLGNIKKSMKSMESIALQGPMTKDRLKRLQEELQKKLGLLQGQGELIIT
ncbi:hypothetical protein CR513_44224, partial [Mucuna pruriens]